MAYVLCEIIKDNDLKVVNIRNGDIGKVTEFDTVDKSVYVKFPHKEVAVQVFADELNFIVKG